MPIRPSRFAPKAAEGLGELASRGPTTPQARPAVTRRPGRRFFADKAVYGVMTRDLTRAAKSLSPCNVVYHALMTNFERLDAACLSRSARGLTALRVRALEHFGAAPQPAAAKPAVHTYCKCNK